jgi:cytochrome c biogenesis protein CcmG/thiol:disulfide interchange protein DsbE
MSSVEPEPNGSDRSRRRRPALFIALGLAVPVLLLVAVLATRQPATTKSVRSPLVGRVAPALEGPTLDGGSFRLSDLRGQWVLVNFFATWCVPCRVENPELIRFADRHAGLGDASVVGVIFQDDPAAVREFRRANGGDWPMVIDTDGRIAVNLGVARVPESYLVNPRGVIVAKLVGGVRDDDLEALFQRQRSSGS